MQTTCESHMTCVGRMPWKVIEAGRYDRRPSFGFGRILREIQAQAHSNHSTLVLAILTGLMQNSRYLVHRRPRLAVTWTRLVGRRTWPIVLRQLLGPHRVLCEVCTNQ